MPRRANANNQKPNAKQYQKVELPKKDGSKSESRTVSLNYLFVCSLSVGG
jgi:hypothetical protein